MAEIKISNQGCVVEAGIAFSSGSPSLDDATLQFVQTLEFTPAYSNGVAIDKEVMLPVAFKLSK